MSVTAYPCKPPFLKENHRIRLKKRLIEENEAELTDSELIELMLYQVHNGEDVRPRVKGILEKFKDVSGLLNATKQELLTTPGITLSFANNIALCKALLLRVKENLRGAPTKKFNLSSLKQISGYIRKEDYFSNPDKFHIIYLDEKHNILIHHYENFSDQGGYLTPPFKVVETAIKRNALKILLITHCSSESCLSPNQPVEYVQELQAIGININLQVHDHILLNQGEFESLKTLGLL